MNTPREQDGESGDTVQPSSPPAPSAGVQLEVAILSEQPAPPPVPSAPIDVPVGLTVLVVAAEADLRHYVRECLRDRVEARILEAASVAEGLTVAAHEPMTLLVVDAPERDVLVGLSHIRAIVIVDELPRHARPLGTRIRFLARPFSADGLVAEVGGLLA